MPQFTAERINFLCHVFLLTSCLCFPSSTPTPPPTPRRPSPGRLPHPVCLHLCPLNPAHMGRRASALFLSAHPSACFHSCVLCLCNLCSRRRGQLFPSHSVPFFLLCFFQSTHKESKKFPTSTEETAVHLGLCENTVFSLSR